MGAIHHLCNLRNLWIVPLLAFARAAFGEERFPPPEFSSGHKMPTHVVLPPRAEWLLYFDVVVLAACLGLASYLTLKRRSRNGVFALMAFSLAYFGFYRKGCVCSVGSIQNVALALARHDYALPITVAAIFLLPLIFALFAGRVFCAGVCPLGAAQDIVLVRPLKVPAWLEHALGLLPYVYLGMGVLFAAMGSTFLVCQYDPIVPFFRRSGSGLMLGLGALTLMLATVVGRPYCRFLCPYGVLLRWLSPWGKWRVSITPDVCIQCKLCEHACPFGAIREPVPEDAAVPRTEGRGRLGVLVALLPVLVLAGAWAGRAGSGTLARMDNKVYLADRIWLEESGKATGVTDESKAFRKQALAPEELYREAAAIRLRYHAAGGWFGAWVGLVIGLKLVFLSIRRRRKDWEADPAACVSCARCYLYCPQEHLRLGMPPPPELAAAGAPVELVAAGGSAAGFLTKEDRTP